MSEDRTGTENLVPQTLADMASTPAPWVGVPTIYRVISDNFEAVHAAKMNGWPWRSIIRPLGLQPSDSSRAAAAYAGLVRRKRRRAQAAQDSQGGDVGEEVPSDPDEWC
jgi:hypothetical protein